MKSNFRLALAVLGVALVGDVAIAQEDSSYIFAVYYVCDQNREAWSDTVTEQFVGPIYDSHVQSGDIAGWGRMSHNAGGEWRRLEYMASSNLDTLIDTRDAIIESIESDAADAGRELTAICPDHDDYIWERVAGSGSMSAQLASRPAAGYSTYYVCDMAKQERADEIIEQVYTPVLNQLVRDGKLKSWNWFSHVLGGKYRRLLAYTGDDHKTLLSAIDQLINQTRSANPDLSTEFSAICGSHDDYLWDNQISRP